MEPIMERDPQTFAIIGAAMEIHRQLGPGFLEPVDQDAAGIEFPAQKIPFEREVLLPVKYKATILPGRSKADFICFSEIVVEFKALARLSSIEEAQVLNYLNSNGFQTRPSVELRNIQSAIQTPRLGI